MSGWQHANPVGSSFISCDACIHGEAKYACTTPTPDPASPCAFEWCGHRGAYWWHTALRVGGDHDQWDRLHPHVPTRCTCGHAIEATR